jgi:hypothetical protein
MGDDQDKKDEKDDMNDGLGLQEDNEKNSQEDNED